MTKRRGHRSNKNVDDPQVVCCDVTEDTSTRISKQIRNEHSPRDRGAIYPAASSSKTKEDIVSGGAHIISLTGEI